MKKRAAKLPVAGRDKLIKAGIQLFGLYGYEGASTRQIAKKAGVNISAIAYYFSGKEGLYAAVLEHISTIARGEMGGRAAKIRETLEKPDLPDAACRELLHSFLGGMIGFLLSPRATIDLGRIIIREQMDPTPAFDLLYEGTMRPMHELVTTLVAKLTGLPFPGEEATICAHTIIGQITIFKTHREAALRRLGWKGYGDREMKKVTDVILRNTDAIIESYRRTA
jgi:TetR/AcrR family transcriptional regulator, regulator of cefoperazone and chloramphenicol sensitivity